MNPFNEKKTEKSKKTNTKTIIRDSVRGFIKHRPI